MIAGQPDDQVDVFSRDYFMFCSPEEERKKENGELVQGRHFLFKTPLFRGVSQLQCGVILFDPSRRLFIRNFVLEDDLQVWRTILHGPRRPSAKWAGPRPPRSLARRNRPARQWEEVRGEGVEAGWSDFQKAEAQAQERPVSEQSKSTFYTGRKEKRVERTPGRDPGSARKSCGNPAGAGGVLGVKLLTALQEKERIMVPASVHAELSRLQSVIDGLQKELSSFRSGQAVQFSGSTTTTWWWICATKDRRSWR